MLTMYNLLNPIRIDDLLNAIRRRDTRNTRIILENLRTQGLSLDEILNKDYKNYQDPNEYNIAGIPLHIAASNNDHDMVDLLLGYGANPAFEDDWGDCARSAASSDTLIEKLSQAMYDREVALSIGKLSL